MLRVAHVLDPLDGLAVARLLDGEVIDKDMIAVPVTGTSRRRR